MDLVLASASPRRAELLAAAGIAFRVDAVDVDEGLRAGESPEQYVVRLARDKARQGLRRNPGSVVLGADTTVVVDQHILAKPVGPADAMRMLELLSGRTHQVLTGVAVCGDERELYGIEQTRVHFLRLSDADVRWYVASGEPFDKAGAYAIQGLASRFVDAIEGSYTNVVGLPVSLAWQLLKALG